MAAGGLCTEPADREAADRGIRMAYEAAGAEPPLVVLWCESPVPACTAAALALAGRMRVHGVTADRPLGWIGRMLAVLRDTARRELLALLEEQSQAELWSQVEQRLWHDPMHRRKPWLWQYRCAPDRGAVPRAAMKLTWESTRAALRDEVSTIWRELWHPVYLIHNIFRRHWADEVKDMWGLAWRGSGLQAGLESSEQLQRQVPESEQRHAFFRCGMDLEHDVKGHCYGPQDTARLSYYDALSRLGSPMLKTFEGLALAARSCGWWWALPGFAIASERPVSVERDSQGRLHCDHAMALQYPDGWGLWRIHGVEVDQRLVLHPESVTVGEILENGNLEVRRTLLERFGYDRFIRETGSRPVSQDEYGTLYRLAISGDEPLVLVHVVDSTPEPDGSVREFFIRVPPQMQTARQAVAWTFGMQEWEYEPHVQS